MIPRKLVNSEKIWNTAGESVSFWRPSNKENCFLLFFVKEFETCDFNVPQCRIKFGNVA